MKAKANTVKGSKKSGKHYRSATSIVKTLANDLDEGHVSFGQLLEMLSEGTFGIAIFFFALPNTIPLGIPFISSICAIPILFFSAQMMMGKNHVHLPKFIKKRGFNGALLKKGLTKCLPWFAKLEKLFRPRLAHFAGEGAQRFVGFVIVLLAIIIFLPVPFGNFAPAFCICLLAMGIMERDGLAVAIGVGSSVITAFVTFYAMAQIVDYGLS